MSYTHVRVAHHDSAPQSLRLFHHKGNFTWPWRDGTCFGYDGAELFYAMACVLRVICRGLQECMGRSVLKCALGLSVAPEYAGLSPRMYFSGQVSVL
jgi:hypothetical protein